MLVYLGVFFLLLGSMIFLFYSGENSTSLYATAGAFISAIGIILCYVALRANRGGSKSEEKGSFELIGARSSLSYLEMEMERFEENEKKASGNKALGFGLLSVGIFLLGIAGFGLFIFAWPFTLLGAGSLIGGIILRNG